MQVTTHWHCSYVLEQLLWLHWRHGLSFTHNKLAWELLQYNIWTKLYIVSSVTCSVPCNTSIRLIPQTYLKVAMWVANTINLSCLHFQSESFMPMLSLWWATVHMDLYMFECKFKVSSQSKQTCKHTHAHVQCIHAIVGARSSLIPRLGYEARLAQAHPNNGWFPSYWTLT